MFKFTKNPKRNTRQAKRQRAPRVGLALGSGGAKGLSHIAFLEALDEMGIQPSIIAGTSIGAAIGAFYASGLTGRRIERIFDGMGIRKMGSMADPAGLSNSGLLKGKKVEAFLTNHLPAKTFEDLEIPLKIVATDFWNRVEEIFDSGDLVTAIRASISIPVVLEPVELGGRVFTDGGAVNPLPYDIIRDECDILIAIDVSGEKVPDEHDPTPSMLENVFSTFQTMQASIVRCKMSTSKPDILVRPDLINIQLMDFHRKDEILDGVKEDVERFRQELEAKL
ncbi:MAG: patatin-like phospholipase family protein [bacterium]|nr:patatin-like phospholipase family protein [bacterium]